MRIILNKLIKSRQDYESVVLGVEIYFSSKKNIVDTIVLGII